MRARSRRPGADRCLAAAPGRGTCKRGQRFRGGSQRASDARSKRPRTVAAETPNTFTRFDRLFSPAIRTIWRLGTPRHVERKAMSSALAAPSTGAAATRMSSASPLVPTSAVRPARGMTVMWTIAPSGASLITPETSARWNPRSLRWPARQRVRAAAAGAAGFSPRGAAYPVRARTRWCSGASR